MDMVDTINALLNLDMDTPQALVIITEVLKEFRDMDTEDITKDLLSQDMDMEVTVMCTEQQKV